MCPRLVDLFFSFFNRTSTEQFFIFAFDRVHVFMNLMNSLVYLWSLYALFFAYIHIIYKLLLWLLIFGNRKFLCSYYPCMYMYLERKRTVICFLHFNFVFAFYVRISFFFFRVNDEILEWLFDLFLHIILISGCSLLFCCSVCICIQSEVNEQ